MFVCVLYEGTVVLGEILEISEIVFGVFLLCLVAIGMAREIFSDGSVLLVFARCCCF